MKGQSFQIEEYIITDNKPNHNACKSDNNFLAEKQKCTKSKNWEALPRKLNCNASLSIFKNYFSLWDNLIVKGRLLPYYTFLAEWGMSIPTGKEKIITQVIFTCSFQLGSGRLRGEGVARYIWKVSPTNERENICDTFFDVKGNGMKICWECETETCV